MFAVRRIFRNNKQLSNYIYTSSVFHCNKDKKPDDFLGKDQFKGSKDPSRSKNVDQGKSIGRLFKSDKKLKKVGDKKAKDIKIDHNDFLTNLRPPKKEKTEKTPFNKAMVSSVNKLASELGGDEEQTKRDLLDYVKMLEAEADPKNIPDNSESDIKPRRMTRGEWIEMSGMPHEVLDLKEKRGPRKTRRLDLFKKSIMKAENQVTLRIWDSLQEEELAAKSKRSPENYYEELIQWTNEGKLWKFPIDNDQGLEKEAAVSFTEHVFLERHLEPWCPKKGPIRKFMEMVLIGLGKNPYLTAKEKRAHIMWFKFYFEQKKKLLQELGAMAPTKLEVPNQESTP